MGDRTVGEVMVLVAGAALGDKMAKDLTAEEWDEFIARCQKEAERLESVGELDVDIEPPSATLDTGHAAAGEGGEGGEGGVVGVDLGAVGGDKSGGGETQTITTEDVGQVSAADLVD